jgi:hypothetical protein
VLSQGRGRVRCTALATPRWSYWTSSNTTPLPPGGCPAPPSVTAHYSLMAAHFPPSPALRTSLHWNLLECTRCIAPGAMQNCIHLPPVPPRIKKYCIRSAANALCYRHCPIEKRHPVNQRTGICHGREIGPSITPPRLPHVSPALTQKVQ